jgi:hypothetical protein
VYVQILFSDPPHHNAIWQLALHQNRAKFGDLIPYVGEQKKVALPQLSRWVKPPLDRAGFTRRRHALVSGPAEAPPVSLLHAACGTGATQWFPNVVRLSGHHRLVGVSSSGIVPVEDSRWANV